MGRVRAYRSRPCLGFPCPDIIRRLFWPPSPLDARLNDCRHCGIKSIIFPLSEDINELHKYKYIAQAAEQEKGSTHPHPRSSTSHSDYATASSVLVVRHLIQFIQMVKEMKYVTYYVKSNRWNELNLPSGAWRMCVAKALIFLSAFMFSTHAAANSKHTNKLQFIFSSVSFISRVSASMKWN